MKRFLFILVAFCILCGCNKDDDKGIANVPNSQTDKPDTPENVPESPNGDWSTEKTGNFIDAFIGTGMTFGLAYHDWSTATFTISFGSDDARYHYLDQDETESTKYKAYAKYYGDTSYIWYHDLAPFESVCLMPLDSISITADRAFDNEHPKGSILNDLFTVKYGAFHSYIKSNYNDMVTTGDYSQKDSLVSATEFKGVSLLNYGTEFLLTKRPAKGKYTFTFTLNFGEDPLTGEKVEVPPASIEVEF